MKIAFDENVPPQMVRVFKTLGQEKRFHRSGVIFVGARDYTPTIGDPDYEKNSDVPWLTRFAGDGGKVVVSGNVKMLEQPHELEALRRHRYIVFLFERKWNGWNFHRKTALLLFNWPLVLAKLKRAGPGEFWCIPNHFKDDAELRDVTPGAKNIVKQGTRTQRATKRAASARVEEAAGRSSKRRRPQDTRQGALELSGGGPRAAGEDRKAQRGR